jgi:hypothetical protein
VINTETMRLQQGLRFMYYTEDVVPAMQLSSDGRHAFGAQATVDLVAGSDQESELHQHIGYSGGLGIEDFAVSPDNKRVAFRGENNPPQEYYGVPRGLNFVYVCP